MTNEELQNELTLLTAKTAARKESIDDFYNRTEKFGMSVVTTITTYKQEQGRAFANVYAMNVGAGMTAQAAYLAAYTIAIGPLPTTGDVDLETLFEGMETTPVELAPVDQAQA